MRRSLIYLIILATIFLNCCSMTIPPELVPYYKEVYAASPYIESGLVFPVERKEELVGAVQLWIQYNETDPDFKVVESLPERYVLETDFMRIMVTIASRSDGVHLVVDYIGTLFGIPIKTEEERFHVCRLLSFVQKYMKGEFKSHEDERLFVKFTNIYYPESALYKKPKRRPVW